jgi:hypothetical protein
MSLPLKLRIKYTLGRYLPFLKIQPPEMDRLGAMTLRPAHNALLTWEKRESGETVLTIPENKSVGALTRMMAKWLSAPTERKVELDEVGGFVWELCDGSNTIEAIIAKTGKQYKMNRREAEVSVTMFLQMLHERNFIGLYKKASKTAAREAEAKQPEGKKTAARQATAKKATTK